MKRHPSEKKLIDLALGIAADEESLRSHLDQCDECRKRFTVYSLSLEESDNRGLRPSVGLEQRIRKSIREKDAHAIPARPLIFRPAVAVLAVAVISVTALLLIFIPERREKVPLAFHSLKGNVEIDQKSTTETYLNPGSTIQTGNDSITEISLKNSFSIILGPKTSLKILQSARKKSEPTVRLLFYLAQGELVARFGHEKIPVIYSFTTAQGRIDSLGTEFFLRSGSSETELAIIQGKVRIAELSGASLEARDGKSYIIRRGITTGTTSRAVEKRIAVLRRYLDPDHGAMPDSGDETVSPLPEPERKIKAELPAETNPATTEGQSAEQEAPSRINGSRAEELQQAREKLQKRREEQKRLRNGTPRERRQR